MACPGVGDQTATPLEGLSPPDLTYHHYVYNPLHMLCLVCLTEELSMRFWGWWLRERKLPGVSGPVELLLGLLVHATTPRGSCTRSGCKSIYNARTSLPYTQFSTATIRPKNGGCGRTGRYLNAPVSTQFHQSLSNISGTTPISYPTPSHQIFTSTSCHRLTLNPDSD